MFLKIFIEMKKECKMFYVKTIAWSIVVKEGTNALILYIFEYGTEYFANVVLNVVLNSIWSFHQQ